MDPNDRRIWWPEVHPQVLLAYVRDGENGLKRFEEQVEQTARSRPKRKFGKAEAAYLPKSPFPPMLWRYSCGRCRFWEDGEPGKPGHCHIVGREDDHWGGRAIHPDGWCGYWMPPEGERPFDWLREQLTPSGADAIRGEFHRSSRK